MSDPQFDPEEQWQNLMRGSRLDRFVARHIRLAGLLFWLELVLPVLFVTVMPILLLAGLALIKVLSVLPFALYGALMVTALVLTLYIPWRNRATFRPIRYTEVTCLLEQRLGLAHNPLRAHADRLPEIYHRDREMVELWSRHHMELRRQLARLPLPEMRIDVWRHDRYLIAVPILLMLVVGVMRSGQDSLWHLQQALLRSGDVTTSPTVLVEGWIEPPEWTGLAPIYLTDQGKVDGVSAPGLVSVPEKSRLVLRVDHSDHQPRLSGPGLDNVLHQEDQSLWSYDADIGLGGLTQLLTDDEVLASWDFDLVIDRAPVILFSELPRISRRQALRIRYEGQDDYGIVAAHLVMRQADEEKSGNTVILEPISWTYDENVQEYRLPIILSGDQEQEIGGNAWFDLTAHPWAGQTVELQLEAEDTAGTIARSRSLRTVLPEKRFSHPVAMEVVALRKMLFRDQNFRDAVADGFDVLRQDPESWNRDFIVQMSLAIAAARLRQDPSQAGSDDSAIADLSWNVAIWLEEGMRARAQERLAALQEKLRRAIDNISEDEEIAGLLDEMDALWQKLREDRERALADMPEDLREMLQGGDVSADQFDRIMEELRRLSEMGDQDALRQMLSQLQDLTNMAPGNNLPGQAERERLQSMMEITKELRAISRDQQALMDRTLRADQFPGTETRRREAGKLIPDQEGLIRRLREMMEQSRETIGEVPGSLQQADQAMRDAIDDMEGAQPDAAMEDQAAAIQALSQGGENMQSMMMMQSFMANSGLGGQIDPLGRRREERNPSGFGSSSGGKYPIPAERSAREARNIWQELQRRLDDPNRSDEEIDYLERLLERF